MKNLKNYIFESGSEATNVFNPEVGSTLYVVNGYRNKTGKPIKVKVKNVAYNINYGGSPFICIEFDKEVYGAKGYSVPADSLNDKVSPEVYRNVYTEHIAVNNIIQVATSLKWLEEYNNEYYNAQIKEIDKQIGELNKEISDIQDQINKKNEEKMKVMSEMIKYEEEK